MQAILSYVIFVINSLVDLLSIQIFPDFPVTIFQFLCSIVIIVYLFRFIFGGTREIDSFTNLSIRDVSRSMNNNDRKEQVVNFNSYSKSSVNINSNKPSWFDYYNDLEAVPLSPSERLEMESMLREFK